MSIQRNALVTGANRGIGLAIAAGLAQQGLHVIIGSRDAAAGKEAAQQLNATSVQLDVADHSSIEAALSHIGDIDVLVNNAGILNNRPLLEDPAGLQESLAVMLYGPYHLIRMTLPAMARNGYGRIVNVSSGWGSFAEGMAGPGGYGIAKAALNALTVSVARTAPKSVKINALCPGWVRTRMGGSDALRTPTEGADSALWLATLPTDGPSGQFFRDRKPIPW